MRPVLPAHKAAFEKQGPGQAAAGIAGHLPKALSGVPTRQAIRRFVFPFRPQLAGVFSETGTDAEKTAANWHNTVLPAKTGLAGEDPF